MCKEETRINTVLIPLLAWIMLSVYLFWGPSFYTYFIQGQGRPSQRGIDISNFISRKNARGYIRELTPYQNKPDIYQINGWAFSKLTPKEPTDIYYTEIVVFNKSRNYVFRTEPIQRVDIVDNFSKLNLTIVNPGFSGLINKHALFWGKYCIAIKLTHTQKGTSQFILSNKVINKTLFGFDLVTDDEKLCKNLLD
jgi:hypothetical protein